MIAALAESESTNSTVTAVSHVSVAFFRKLLSIGRLVRLGFKHYDNRQRRLYHFRNRHGFTDAADEAFKRLWTADDLTWSDIAALSEKASAAAA